MVSRSRAASTRNTTTPKPASCPACGAAILVGWYRDTPLALDADAINLLGETQALVRGRRTFEISGFGIVRRCAEAIKFIPRPTITDIHREHRCGDPPVGDGEKRPPKTTPYWGDDPPF